MSRFFAPISVADFRAKAEKAFTEGEGDDAYIDHNLIEEVVGKDLKVSFSFENFYYKEQDWHGDQQLLGIHTLENGLTYWGMTSGGDWEHPIFFLIYWDGKKLRGYIPTDGNPWNTDTKEAYGNDDEKDLKNAKKRWPEAFKDAEDIDSGDFEFEWPLIKADIMARIQPKGAAPAKKKPAKKQPEGAKSLQERIEALTFYGCGDEAYELFQKACSFCYSLYGLGMTEEATIVCGWAEQMAHASKGEELSDHDIEKGYWGY